MRLRTLAALAGTALAGLLLLPADADAAPRKRQKQTEDFFFTSPDRRVVQSRPRSRITVQRRSYLDAGTEVMPGERKFREYATPYGYSAIDDILGPGKGWNRTPFNDPYDVPGRPWPGGFPF
jgi:hypothetical protein